jgi:hypothetical protein
LLDPQVADGSPARTHEQVKVGGRGIGIQAQVAGQLPSLMPLGQQIQEKWRPRWEPTAHQVDRKPDRQRARILYGVVFRQRDGAVIE